MGEANYGSPEGITHFFVQQRQVSQGLTTFAGKNLYHDEILALVELAVVAHRLYP